MRRPCATSFDWRSASAPVAEPQFWGILRSHAAVPIDQGMATTTKNTSTKPVKAAATKQLSKTKRSTTVLKSRAVTREVEAGSTVDCNFCGERVKFQAKMRNRQVICNVYIKGVWSRVEHFHADCYATAGAPHGEAAAPPERRGAGAAAAAAAAATAATAAAEAAAAGTTTAATTDAAQPSKTATTS